MRLKASLFSDSHPFSLEIENIFLRTIENEELIKPNDSVLIGLSGGADSVALCCLLTKFKDKLKINLRAVHIHHGIRGGEADRDAEFSESLCRDLGIDFSIEKIDTPLHAKNNKISLEMAGRELRYRVFSETARRYQCSVIATAHHLDDRIETILLRLFKGTGGSGLAGIPVKRENIIRPLLYIEKNNILRYLEENNIDYITDSSNLEIDFERNYIRSEIIPRINEKFPQFRYKINDLSFIIRQEEEVWKQNYQPLNHFAKIENNQILIEKEVFFNQPGLVRRWLRELIGRHIDTSFNLNLTQYEIISNFRADTEGNKILYDDGRIRIVSSYGLIIIEKRDKNFQNGVKYVKIHDNFKVSYNGKDLTFSAVNINSESVFYSDKTHCMIKNGLYNELILRERKNGDRIKLSNGKTKKLKDFFVDKKFSMSQRESAIVFEIEGQVAVVFIPGFGFRVSSDFYVSEKQQDGIKISVEND